ncbi:MAG: DnaD domain protein [Oscillospiraceae bacterium]|nr:DnaD domain protein [Oscillospiraceae bacterium]
MEYTVNMGCWSSVFAVPSAVVDEYIKLASGNAVKVLLYMLRHNGQKISDETISQSLNLGKDDVCDAIRFWQEVKLLENAPSVNSAPAVPVNSTVKETTPAPQKTQASLNAEAANETQSYIQQSSGNFHITPSELTARMEKSKDIKMMFDIAQQTLGTTLNHSLCKSLLWQNDYLGLSIDVILMLLSYCVSIGKTSSAYIETVAIDWSQREINSLEKAQNEIQRMTDSRSFASKVSASFGLKRSPTPNQQKFIEEWFSAGVDPDLIACACERTVDLNKTLTMNYVNAIIVNWRNEGITTRAQAETTFRNAGTKQSYKKQYQPKSDASYNISEFDKFAINYSENMKGTD